MDKNDIKVILNDDVKLSEKVEQFFLFDNLDELDDFVELVNSDVFFMDNSLFGLSEEDINKLEEVFDKMEKYIKQENDKNQKEIKNIKSKIDEKIKEVNGFEPLELDSEKVKKISYLVSQQKTLNNRKAQIELECDKFKKILQLFNKANKEIDDRRIDIVNSKNSKEQKEIESSLENVEKQLQEQKAELAELSEEKNNDDEQLKECFEKLKKFISQNEDQQKQEEILAVLNEIVEKQKQNKEGIDKLEKSIQKLENKRANLEDMKSKNQKKLDKQEQSDKRRAERISKFEELAKKENLTKIEMGIFKGIHDEIIHNPDIKADEKKIYDDKYIKKVSGVAPDSSRIIPSDGIKPQNEVAKVSRIKSRVAKAKVSTLLFIKGKFDKVVNKRSDFKEKSIDKKTRKLEEKRKKINTKITELDSMKARLQKLYTNNPNLEQEDVPSARRM